MNNIRVSVDSHRKYPIPLLLALALIPCASASAQSEAVKEKSKELPTNESTALSSKTQKQLTSELNKGAGSTDESPIELSPFVVTSDSNKGYEATNTMSGTRLNSKLEDIAATISVVTKQQMLDFGATDINDIYAMDAGTDGTRTFTMPGNDSKGDVDNVALNPNSANRIRGIGTANMAIGGFAMSNSIPIDVYNIDAVEISKGPNSSIFGVGEVSGTVNLVPSAANTQKTSSNASMSISSFGGQRASIDLNRPILKNVLAVRFSSLAENKGFVRKPSFDKIRRYQGALTFRPFKYTTLRASWENFDEKYCRANTMMPRDYVSIWKSVGSPSWDPSTNVWSYTDSNGVVQTGTKGGIRSGVATIFPAAVWLQGQGSAAVRPTMFIDDGQAQWFGPTYWLSANAATPGRELVNFFVPTGAAAIAGGASYYGVPNGYIPSSNANVAGTLGYQAIKATTDKSFYDYESINLAALNRAYKKADTYRIELEQFFLSSQRQLLGLQASAFGERIDDYSKAYVGNGGDGVSVSIMPDVNKTLPDGTANPHFGSPYIGALSPQIYSRPVTTDTFRLNLAYQLDLSSEKSLWRIFGKQRVVGYLEDYTKEFAPNSIRYSEQIVSTYPTNMMQSGAAWMALPANGNFSRNNSAIWNARYYLGSNPDGRITYAPTTPDLSQGATYHRWGNDLGLTTATSNTWLTNTVPFGETYYTLGMQQTKVSTKGMVIQSSFWDDRIVTTFGRRQDALRSRNGPATWATGPASSRDANGLYVDTAWLSDFSSSPWLVTNKATGSTVNKGITDTQGLVFKAFPWLHLRYNTSDSFKPDSYVLDFNGEPLPNPHGKTKDYGFRLNLLDNKLSIGLTRYDTQSLGARPGSGVAGRAFNIDFDPAASSFNMDLQSWLMAELLKKTPTATTSELEAQANQLAGLDADFISTIRNNTTAITQDVVSKGYELDVFYNPNRYWTVRLSGAKTESIISNYGGGFISYVNERLKTWQSIVSPYDGVTKFWDATQPATNGYTTARDWFTNLVWNPMQLTLALQGQPQPQVRKYKANIMSSYRLAGITKSAVLRDMSVGGNVRWEDKGAIGFYGAAPVTDPANPDVGKVFVRSYDISRPIYDPSRTYVDLFVGYNFRLKSDRIRGQLQLNVRNVTESGSIRAIQANPDGTPYNFRIVDPREFIVSMRFDL